MAQDKDRKGPKVNEEHGRVIKNDDEKRSAQPVVVTPTESKDPNKNRR